MAEVAAKTAKQDRAERGAECEPEAASGPVAGSKPTRWVVRSHLACDGRRLIVLPAAPVAALEPLLPRTLRLRRGGGAEDRPVTGRRRRLAALGGVDSQDLPGIAGVTGKPL